MLLGIAGILLALLAVWICVEVWPIWQVQTSIDRLAGEKDDPRGVLDRMIARLGGKEATAHKVTRYLQTGRRSADRRRAALTLLEFSFTREAIPGLIILAGDEDSDIRGGAVELLSDEYGADARSFDVLAAALADEQADDFTRSWASRGLARIEDPRSVELMVAALRSKNEAVREVVAADLKQLGNPRTAELLDPLLKDKDEEVRKAAEQLLKELR
jgi:hypothetical protein